MAKTVLSPSPTGSLLSQPGVLLPPAPHRAAPAAAEWFLPGGPAPYSRTRTCTFWGVVASYRDARRRTW